MLFNFASEIKTLCNMEDKIYIHPYKGYLNTEFQIYSHELDSVEYTIYPKNENISNDATLIKGVIKPNTPNSFRVSSAGIFVIKFNIGTSREIIVEDAYRFGGNKHKKSFIFDYCPWAFVVMHDRTYFYNRESKESFVEAISPDEIVEISKDYVLFKNENQRDFSLFSLLEQRPILYIDNVIFSNEELFIWEEKNEDNKPSTMKVFSLKKNEILIEELFTCYSLNSCKCCIYLANKNDIKTISLDETPTLSEPISFKGQFVTFAQSHYAICHEFGTIKVWDVETREEQAEITPSSCLARINDVTFIDVVSRRRAISNFDLRNSDFPEAEISAQYCEYDIYPCEWRVFYVQKDIVISSDKENNKTIRCICDNKKNIHQEIKNDNGNVIFTGNAFCWYKDNESYVACRVYDHTSYCTDSKVYIFKDKAYLGDTRNLRTLSRNGFWDGNWETEGEFVFDYFEDYGVIYDKVNKIYYNHSKKELGVQKGRRSDYLEIGDYLYNKCGKRVLKKGTPQTISASMNYGLNVDSKGVKFFEYKNNVFESDAILEGIYDTSTYSNVLLSDNGCQIMYREKELSTVLDVESGRKTEFKNLSYVNHINGIRPLFITEMECSQARLINPLDGQPIDVGLLTQYQFISPDGSLYADKELRKYIEYRNKIIGKTISREDYLDLVKQLDVPNDKWSKWILSLKKEEVREEIEEIFKLRDKFIEEHVEYFTGLAKEARNIRFFLHNVARHQEFTNLFIKILGIAIIRRMDTGEVVEKIELGSPLAYLNYVSFSHNNQYVAIAGCYPFGVSTGGMFLLYDLKEHMTIYRNGVSKAVWTTAFTKDGIVAAYTSSPTTFIGKCNEVKSGESKEDSKLSIIRGYNFLTYSPDGLYFACSQQGYIAYRDGNGNINPNWGHQPSSLVDIRMTSNPNEVLISFNDLSEMGIADAYCSQSVSSVSFSNDNKKLLMVGKDGVVIVRNLYLEEYASK